MQTAREFWETLLPLGGSLGEHEAVEALERFRAEAVTAERERCAQIVNDARRSGHTDLRSLVSRIRSPD